jgi:valyl-tRNA synthetase
VGYGAVGAVEVLVPLAGLIDPSAEAARLDREIAKAEKERDKLSKQLENTAFLERAPAETVAQTRGERDALVSKVQRLRAALETVRESG